MNGSLPQQSAPLDGGPSSLPPRPGQDFARRTKRFRGWTASTCAVVVALVGWGALFTAPGQALDTLIMYSFQEHMPFRGVARIILHSMVSIPVLLLLSAIILLAIFWRRRFALLWRAGLVLIVANAATQGLKWLVSRPDFAVGHNLENSFPSGHVTFAVSVVLILVYSVPDRWRFFTSLLAWSAIVAVSVSVLSLGWHRLSDVIAAILVSTGSSVLLLPSQWRPFDDRYRGRTLGSFSWSVLVIACVAMGVFAWVTRSLLSAPVTALELGGLALTPAVGVPCVAISSLIILSVATLSVRGVDRLAGN